MVHIILLVFIWYTVAWKNKTMRNFICLYSHVKFNRFFHFVLQYFIILNWKLELTKLTWIISSRLIDNVKSCEMKCTDISHIQRNQSQPKRFWLYLNFNPLSQWLSVSFYFTSHQALLALTRWYILFWFMLSFLHTDWTTSLPCLFALCYGQGLHDYSLRQTLS